MKFPLRAAPIIPNDQLQYISNILSLSEIQYKFPEVGHIANVYEYVYILVSWNLFLLGETFFNNLP